MPKHLSFAQQADIPKPVTSPTSPSSHRPFPMPNSHPPVPSIPPGYVPSSSSELIRNGRRSPPPSDPFSKIPPTSPVSTPSSNRTSSSTSASPGENGRVSITPTERRRVPNGSGNVDKPLPSLRPSENITAVASSSRRMASHPIRGSGHTRQAATIQEDDSSSSNYSPQPPVMTSFSDDVAGMFDGIGQSEPAKELGLPPDSLRSNDKSSVKETRNYAIELGVTSPADPSKSSMSPSPLPSKRTSSLPSGSSKVENPPRRKSSPLLDEMSLKPPRPVSRASSSSSRRRRKDTANGGSYAALTAPLGSPLLINNGYFGAPLEIEDRASIEQLRKKDFSPPLPQSARLVSSPQPDTAAVDKIIPQSPPTEPSFTAHPPWGAQSPRPPDRSPSKLDDPLEYVDSPVAPKTDDREDDEEKGRRMACDFLDNDHSHVPADKVAMFLGGP